MIMGGRHIGGVATRDADALAHQPQDLVLGQPSRILPVALVDGVDQRVQDAAIVKARAQHHLAVDHGHLFALAQIGDGRLPIQSRHLEGHAPAGAAPVEAQNQPRARGGAAMHMGIDAERAMKAMDRRQMALHESKARPPHERTIAKHPEIPVVGHGFRVFCEPEGL